MTRDELRAWVAQSRAQQGLPPAIQDPATVAQVGAMAARVLAQQEPGAAMAQKGADSEAA
jgi:hypothetical protein